jgi:hypothetical protein
MPNFKPETIEWYTKRSKPKADNGTLGAHTYVAQKMPDYRDLPFVDVLFVCRWSVLPYKAGRYFPTMEKFCKWVTYDGICYGMDDIDAWAYMPKGPLRRRLPRQK